MNDQKIIVATKQELVSLIEDTVRRVLSEIKSPSPQLERGNSPLLLSLQEAAGFLKLAPQTIYGFTSKRVIPFLKRGKKLYFKRVELEQWLEEGKKKSISQLNKEIDQNGTLKF